MKRLAIPLLVVLGSLIPLAGAWAQPGMAKEGSSPRRWNGCAGARRGRGWASDS